MIENIELKNYKCFEKMNIPLKNVNLFTGINGMGKSSVIQALLLLRQSYKSNGLKTGLELAGHYVDLGQGKDVLYEKAGKNDNIGITIIENSQQFSYEFKYDADSTLLENYSVKNIANVVKTENFVYLSAYRIEPLKFYGVANKQNMDRREFGNNGEFSVQYLKEYGHLKEHRHLDEQRELGLDIMEQKESQEYKDLNQQVQEWMKVISPGAVPVVDINKMLNVSELRFRFIEGANKTESYRCVNVGFGLTYVLPIIVALLSSREGDIIILENPEAHIHPAGQRKLGELIGECGQRGIQVIVETHSDHIMNGIRVAVKNGTLDKENVNFAYFYKETFGDYEHKCMFPKIDGNGKFDMWPEGFFDEWDNSLLDLL